MQLRTGDRYAPAQVLPHRRGMLLAETVDYGPDCGRIALTVREDSPFCEGARGVPAWVGIEYMAQAMGVYSGVERHQHGGTPQIGLLIGTRRYDSSVPVFSLGAQLTTTARLVFSDAEMYVFNCEISDGQNVLARGDIKAFRPDDIHEFLRRA
jgi:predicted hotdog family 3-hydroxylacyl-ACP dehydratase